LLSDGLIMSRDGRFIGNLPAWAFRAWWPFRLPPVRLAH
jgi:hypothetical protein